uniref:hypothetical chloroplast RF19 n=1 Tax=Euphorbia hypericifolia TaxID=212834 RepID=UPI002410E6C8|nr:hypothetical chloroplast RF19 [Euphorbia hypericifolia]WEH01407.1 hypothetical chloroplast RF19 [Euphorbia hypericifolia]
MIFQSFILRNLVDLCMKILNSVVVVGLYYGFLTTFSMGPSYLFLLRAWFIEEGEEGTEKKLAATTGFITGQLMMFISIYYAPLHLALDRPHTITVLALPYLFFHFCWNNKPDFFDYGSTNRNSMRNLSIQFVFLNNLIFQFFNHFFFPSSIVARLVNIYMFRCNNKMLFVTSSFVGWLIGHILFMKWVGLILVWVQQNKSVRSNVLFRSKLFRSNNYLVSEFKYLVLEWLNSMDRIFTILLLITCIFSLGRAPSPLLTPRISQTEETDVETEETDVETEETDVETTSETKGTKQEQEGSTEEDPFSSLFSEEKEDPDKIDETEEIQVNGKQKTKIEKKKKNLVWVEKPVATLLFDSRHWNRPLRYLKNINNQHFSNPYPLRKEMGQYFFYTCLSDGKERISFTYPPSLSTFLERIKRKISLFLTQKISSDELYNHWNSKNEQKYRYISNEFRNRVQTLDKGYLASKTLEKRTRVCNDKTKKEYLPQTYDPLLNGSYRGKTQFFFSSSPLNKTFRTNFNFNFKDNFNFEVEDNFNFKERFWINKIHLLLLNTNYTNYVEFEGKMDLFNSINRKLNSINRKQQSFARKIAFKELSFFELLVDTVMMNPKKKKSRNNLKEIGKKVPQWPYKLIDRLEYEEGKDNGNPVLSADFQIRSRKAELTMLFGDKKLIWAANEQNKDTYNNTQNPRKSNRPIYLDEVTFIRYFKKTDFHRDVIKGSARAQRRKTTTRPMARVTLHSPIFVDRIKNFFVSLWLSHRIVFQLIKTMFINCMFKKKEFKIFDATYRNKNIKKNNKTDKRKNNKINASQREKKQRESREYTQIEVAKDWDNQSYGIQIRNFLLLFHSILRKYILIPSLIIIKNIIRLVLDESPEWSDDFKDWRREVHVKCTYNGVPFSETEFPPNWFFSGIQIQILFPFRFKPWRRSKLKFPYKDRKVQEEDFTFLTVMGLETDFPFGPPRKDLALFNLKPIVKKLKKKISRFIKNSFVRQEKLKKLSKSNRNQKFLSEFREVDELNKNKKDSTINNNNSTVSKLSIPIGSMPCTNYSLIETQMNYLSARRKRVLNEIEEITNAKKFNSSNKIPYILILQRKNARLVHKFYFFIKFLIENIYIDGFVGIINRPRLNAHLFLFLIKKIITKYIANNESNQIANNKSNKKKIDKLNQNKFKFISIIKKSRDIAVINNNSKIFCDISFLSQAYVFYKLSQTKILKVYKLRSIFEYQNLFLKTEIKNYFRAEGLFNSELKEKNWINSFSLINQWKNWLRSHYQYKYDLSQVRWSRLIPEKCKNRIYQHHIVEKKKLSKCNLHEQDQLIDYEKTNDFEVNLFANQKNNFKKHARYSLFAYKSINYEKKTDFFIYESRTNKATNLSNSNINKSKLFDILEEGIPMTNYLAEREILDIKKSPYRKYFDWRLINFCLQKKVDIESWIDTCSKDKKKTKTRNKNYQIIDKIDKKNISFFPIYFELWFFRKFVILYNTYKRKPWTIPIQFLLENFQKNSSTNTETEIYENKFINVRQNETYLTYRLPFLLNEFFLFQLRCDSEISFSDQIIDYIKTCILLITMRNPREILISSIKRKELNINILVARRSPPVREMMKKKIFRIEPTHVSVKTDGKFLLYQMVGILLVHKNKEQINKNKEQINKKSREKFENIEKLFDERRHKRRSKRRHKRRHNRIGNTEKTDYDLLVPENIFSPKRRRELRIRSSFNFKNKNDIHKNTEIFNGNNIKKGSPVLEKNKNFWREKNNLIKLKFFLWPNFRLEDLACMNRYWFNTTNGSRFGMVRIYIYPRLKF